MQVEEAIREVCLAKEHFLVKLLSAYPSKRNFFEMMRFDFVVDEDLNVFIMEVIFYFVNTVLAVQVVGFAPRPPFGCKFTSLICLLHPFQSKLIQFMDRVFYLG